MPSTNRIAIIGAGAAGLTCAQRLLEGGTDPTSLRVYEKSRGIGGRVATRRRPGFNWMHGAPVADLSVGNSVPAACYRRRLTAIAGNVPLQRGLQLSKIEPGATGRYRLRFSNGADASCDTLLLCLPAPQIMTLLSHSGLTPLSGIDQVQMLPRWSLLLGLRRPLPAAVSLTVPFVQSQFSADRRSVVLHTRSDWSAQQLEWPRSLQAQRLLKLAPPVVQQHGPLRVMAHRWRYGVVSQPAERPYCWDAGRGLGAAGDWCTGHRVGDAVTSGQALAAALQSAGDV